jgi:penicillin-binding protein 2
VPTDQWKRQLFAEPWTTGDSYNMAIGQGYVLATPMQVLHRNMAVANGGTIYVPKVVHHMTDANGGVQQDFEPQIKRRLPYRSEELDVIVRRGMWDVVNAPITAPGAQPRCREWCSAGKTGTAEFCEYIPEEEDCRRDDEDNLPTHAWFAAFGPYDNPEIAIVDLYLRRR